MTSSNFRILFVVTIICMFCYGNASRIRKLGDLGLAMDLIEHQYVETADGKSLYSAAMNGILDSLDPYSSYIPEESLKPFQAVLEQEFGGLGISVDGPPRRERLTIVSALYDSPAFRAGIKPGDEILEVNGVDVNQMRYEEATKLMRGKEGTVAVLKIQRQGEEVPRHISITRARIEVESVLGDKRQDNGKWNYNLEADPDIGYFHVEIFGEKTAKELTQAIQERKDWKGLILDLRDNTGGLLYSAIEICDLFLDEGEIVSTRGRNGVVEEVYHAKKGTIVSSEIPIVVLVNEQSASASEILAACLQDHDRAVVVGARTFGKGSVQNVLPLEGGKAAMRLTTAHYYPPKGRRIARPNDAKEDDEWGVLPNEGWGISTDEKGIVAIYDRFRKRADPAFKAATPEESQTNSFIQRDPTLRDDPQLLRAIEAIEQSATNPHVDN